MSLEHEAKPVLKTSIPAMATPAAGRALAVLRLAMGSLFLWAFLDKLFGLGYATRSAGAWIGGGSPAKGFLGHVEVGPFQSALRGMAGSGWVDLAFMLGLAGIGVAVLLGVALRISAVAGSVMMALMWIAEWPLAQHTSAGTPSGSTNPLIDYHVAARSHRGARSACAEGYARGGAQRRPADILTSAGRRAVCTLGRTDCVERGRSTGRLS